ncbi:ADP-ribosyl-(dinitrogen reductase) hydrolase [Limnohabitans sp. B9-3]|nr:ADP-ribosyl-(dinitrogen reductase) hydrolase [Limnohabitans sp. B9-3]
MNHLIISQGILRKLSIKHAVTRQEVEQCFVNRSGRLLMDTRERHKTDPPTLWFLALTNQSRILKIVYIQIGSTIYLKSAFSPNETEIEIYSRYG